MGRNRKPRNAVGSAFEYGDSGFVTSDGRLVREEQLPLAGTATAAQLVQQIFAESNATANEVVNGIGPLNLNQGGVWRTVPDGALRRAWERTDAATLARVLPVDSSSYDERLPALLNTFDLPTPREFFDMERPRRPKLAKKDVEDFATTLNGMLSAFTDGGQAQWRALREIMTYYGRGGFNAETQGGPDIVGFNLMPSTLDQRFRTASSATTTFKNVVKVAKDIAAKTDIPEKRRLQAIMMADAIGGYHLIRERLYETMILSGGSTSPKGQHLAKAVKAINVEVRRLSRQINVVMREEAASTVRSAATGLPPLQKEGTIGRSIYRTLYTEPGDNAFARSGLIIQGLIRAGKYGEMQNINNN